MRQNFLLKFRDICEWIEIAKRIQVCRDKKDDKFLELAVNGKADMIITGCPDLLELNPYERIRIINPSAYWEMQKKNI